LARRGRHSVSGGSRRKETTESSSAALPPPAVEPSPWQAAPAVVAEAPVALTSAAVDEEEVVTGEVPVVSPEPSVRSAMPALWAATGSIGVSLGGAPAPELHQEPPAAVEQAPVEVSPEPVVAAAPMSLEQEDPGLLAEAVLYLPADEAAEETAPTIARIERQRGLVPGSYWDLTERILPPDVPVGGDGPEPAHGLEGTYWDLSHRVLPTGPDQIDDVDVATQPGGYWDRSTIHR
jgi:hypothetical protein